MEHTVRIFYPRLELTDDSPNRVITEVTPLKDGGRRLTVSILWDGFLQSKEQVLSSAQRADERHVLCRLVYQLLCQQSGKNPPWGMLIGVRPVHLVHQQLNQGKSPEQVEQWLSDRYFVSPQKASLAVQTGVVQTPLMEKMKGKVSLYIGIPFCPTRCSYCSFVSQETGEMGELIPEYLRLLQQEIQDFGEIIADQALTLQTVYVGGGTPTTLTATELDKLLTTVTSVLDMSAVEEFTVEAGRPDTITQDKLQVLADHGVDRVSINPQTLSDTVLRRIGRQHSVAEFFSAYDMARKTGFSAINVDLIAGLPGENASDFLNGLEQIIALEPENITVHTLTIKRSSTLWDAAPAFDSPLDLSQLLIDSQHRLSGEGYRPYYLYRQKGTRQNQENVGWSQPGKASLYNIAMMEEIQTVFGAGAGSTTKMVGVAPQIERIFNFKYPYEYIHRFDEIYQRKQRIRSYYERD